MPKCFHCNEELTWQNDYDTEDVGGDEVYLLYLCINVQIKTARRGMKCLMD
jgi:hypothetical protein